MKRYDFEYEYEGTDDIECDPIERKDGDYVAYKDYKAEIDSLNLKIKGWQQENTELEDKIDELERQYKELLHATTTCALQKKIDELVDMLERCEEALGKPPKQQYIQKLASELITKHRG